MTLGVQSVNVKIYALLTSVTITNKLQVTSYKLRATEIKEELTFLATRTTFSTTKTAATEDQDN